MKANARVLQPSQPKSPLPYKRYARRQTTARTWTFVKDWDDSKKEFPAKISPTAQVLVKADPKLSVNKKKNVEDLESPDDDGTSDVLSDEGSDVTRKPGLNTKKHVIPETDQETTETGQVLRSSSKKGTSKREKTVETSTLKENLLTPRSLRSKKDNDLNTTEVLSRKDNSSASRSLRSAKDSDISTTEVLSHKDKSFKSRTIDLDKSEDGLTESSPKKRSNKLTVNKSVVDDPNKISQDVEDSDVITSRTLRSGKKPPEALKIEGVKQNTENLKSVNNRSIRQTCDTNSIEKETVPVENADSIDGPAESDVKRKRKKSGTFDIPVLVSSDRSPDPDQKTPEKLVLLHPETHMIAKSSEKKKRQKEAVITAEFERGSENEVTDQDEPRSKFLDNTINQKDNLKESVTSGLNKDTEDSAMAVGNNDIDVSVGQRSSSLFSSSMRSNKDFVDEELKLQSNEDKMDEIDGERDSVYDDKDDENVDDGIEMSEGEQISSPKNDGVKVNNMAEDDDNDDVIMSNDEQISIEKSSSPLGKRKRSLQDKDQNNVEVTNLKVTNVSKKGKMTGMKKITSAEAVDDRHEQNVKEIMNDHTVDKSINVVEHSDIQKSKSQNQQKSPQQSKTAVRFKSSEKPDKKKTDREPGQSLPIWCGGLHQRYKKDILDLDVVLDSMSNHLEEERSNCDSIAERKAVKKMMLYLKKEITDTIDKVESLKTVNISVKHSKKNIKELRQQLLKTEEDKSRLMSQMAEKKKQFNENLHKVNSWITGFEKLMHISSRKSTKMSHSQKLLTYGCFPV